MSGRNEGWRDVPQSALLAASAATGAIIAVPECLDFHSKGGPWMLGSPLIFFAAGLHRGEGMRTAVCARAITGRMEGRGGKHVGGREAVFFYFSKNFLENVLTRQ